MRYLSILVLTVNTLVCNAQLSINNDYSLNVILITNKEKLPNSIDISLPALQALSANQKSSFKKQLLVYLKETRNNLMDDSLFLEKDYESLWPGFYNSYLGQTNQLIKFLEDQPYAGTFTYLPSPTDIKQFWNSPPGPRKENGPLSNEYVKQFHVYKVNPFSYWLYDRIKEGLYDGTYPFKEMNIEYRKAWRELEYWYDSLPKEIERLQHLRDTIFSMKSFQEEYAKIQAIKKTFGKNVVRKYVQEDDDFRKLLWFSGGLLHMNPLLVTSSDRKYPMTEINRFLKPSFKGFIDSLEKNGFLTSLLTTEKLVNDIRFPLKQTTDDPKEKTLVIHYDAKSNYHASTLSADYEYNAAKLIVLIHNLPADKKAKLKVSGKEIPNESKAITASNEVFSAIGDVVKLLSPFAAVATKITNVSEPPVRTVSGGIGIPTAYKAVNAEHGSRDAIAKTDFQTILIDKKPIILSGTSDADKKIIITESLFSEDEPLSNEMEEIINRYVHDKRINELDYGHVAAAAKGLLIDFRTYLNQILIDEINGLATMHAKVEAITRIYNRSLPPLEINANVDKVAELRTEVYEEPLPKATAKVEYTITESDKEDKQSRTVASHAFKQAKKTRWDISAGLSYTYFDSYNITASLVNGLPQIKSANHFQFMAAFHLYPAGMTKIKDRAFKEGAERVSLFAGLSFSKPLDNYFVGIGYDIVPGIKIMGGAHLYRNTNYKIVNDKVLDQASALKFMGPFLAFNIETKTIGQILGIFK